MTEQEGFRWRERAELAERSVEALKAQIAVLQTRIERLKTGMRIACAELRARTPELAGMRKWKA